MRGFFLILLVCSWIGLGCYSSTKKTIPLEKMALVVADLDLADKMVREFPNALQDSMSEVLEKSLLKVHKLSAEELETNLYLYQTDYKEYEKLLMKLSEIYDAKFKS